MSSCNSIVLAFVNLVFLVSFSHNHPPSHLCCFVLCISFLCFFFLVEISLSGFAGSFLLHNILPSSPRNTTIFFN